MFGSINNRQWPIGLDIGADSIKMLQLHKTGPTVVVTACARWRFPEGTTDQPAPRREQAIEAVRTMLKRNPFDGRRVVSVLPSRDLNIKSLRIPHAAVAPDAVVAKEALQRYNFNVTADRLRYLQAGQVRSGDEIHDEIIMMGVRTETIDSHLALLAAMGVEPEHIDAEPVALFGTFARYLRRRADEEAVSVVVDIGAAATRVIVGRGREIVFIKQIDIGGRNLTDAVAKQLSLTRIEAAEMRQRALHAAATADEDPQTPSKEMTRDSVDWMVYDAVRGEMETLAREVALCLRYCTVTFRGLRPQRVLIAGGEAHDPMLVKLLGEHLNVPCEAGHPLRGIELAGADFGADRRGMLSEWALATGLAIRNIPFGEEDREEGDAEHGRHRLSA